MKIKLCVKVHKYAHMQIMDIRTIINNIIFVYIHWLGVCMFYMCRYCSSMQDCCANCANCIWLMYVRVPCILWLIVIWSLNDVSKLDVKRVNNAAIPPPCVHCRLHRSTYPNAINYTSKEAGAVHSHSSAAALRWGGSVAGHGERERGGIDIYIHSMYCTYIIICIQLSELCM